MQQPFGRVSSLLNSWMQPNAAQSKGNPAGHQYPNSLGTLTNTKRLSRSCSKKGIVSSQENLVTISYLSPHVIDTDPPTSPVVEMAPILEHCWQSGENLQ
jgi:hypothetical protein